MKPHAWPAVLAVVLTLGAPASAGARGGLSVWPVRATVATGSGTVVHIANRTRRAAAVQVGLAGLALDLRGTPRVTAVVRGRPHLLVRPSRLLVGPGRTGTFTVRALASGASAGDHPALVLVTARTGGGAGIGVRLRIGVALEVRVRGPVRHRVELGALHLRGHRLELMVRNRGNVAERVGRGFVAVQLWRGNRLLTLLQPRPRELLPHSRGLVEFAAARALRGRFRAVAVVPAGPPSSRSFDVAF